MTPWQLQVGELLRPIRRWAPRGCGFFYAKILGRYYNYRADAGLKVSLDKRHRVFYDHFLQSYVSVDLGDWACRAHYFKGIYYDRTVPLLIDRILSGGGTFVDVGANRGIHTLYASKKLSTSGVVYAFEPHPVTFDVLKAHLTINSINNCSAFNIGISKEEGTLNLNMFADQHSGTCSFVNSNNVFESVSVPVKKLDNVLDIKSIKGPLLVKIDVEGFEHQVLQGMENLLERPDINLVCEITDQWLRQADSSAASLFEFLRSRGFSAYLPKITYKNIFKENLELILLNDVPNDRQFDVVFIRP
jgi:FkbM family methyltransferase